MYGSTYKTNHNSSHPGVNYIISTPWQSAVGHVTSCPVPHDGCPMIKGVSVSIKSITKYIMADSDRHDSERLRGFDY